MSADVLQAFSNMMDIRLILLIFLGVAIGIVFGSIPGLTATMAIVMFLPMTYTMTPLYGISMLVALYIGGISRRIDIRDPAEYPGNAVLHRHHP